MREIKFRFWLPFVHKGVIEGGRWLDPEFCMINGIGQIGDCSEGYFWELRKEVIAEQFTGYDDINDIDIYEGDITNKGKIFWYAPESKFVIIDKHGNMDDFTDTESIGCEVIGNIHENPELLK